MKWIAIAFVLAGCASMPTNGTEPNEQRSIEIVSPLPPAEALSRIQAAALRGGWSVASINDQMLTLDTFTPQKAKAFNVRLRANAISAPTGSTVFITGQYGNAVFDKKGGEPANPIVGGPFGRMNYVGPVLWGELERFADAARTAVAR